MTTLEKLEDLIYKGFKETDRKFQETDRKFQETDRKFQETDRMQKENAKESKKTDKKFRELREHVAGLTDSVGLFAEHMVKPAMERLFAKRGVELTDLHSRIRHRRNGSTMEVDVLGAGPKHIVAVEVKFHLKLEDVQDFLQRLPRFFDFFERYRGLELYGAVAGMSIDEAVDRYAYNHGLFVLAQSGENIRLLNDEKFRPHVYTYSA